METLFLTCAVLGGTVMVCQVLAGLIGFSGDHDVDHDDGGGDAHDHSGNWFVGILTFRTVTAAVTFFGLGGLTAGYYGIVDVPQFGIAVGSAAIALYLVAMIMKSLKNLRSDGTVRMERAIGTTGSVYLRIPSQKSGHGKVQINVQNRTVEYQAVTAGAEIPTGAAVRVVAIVGPDTVEVEAV